MRRNLSLLLLLVAALLMAACSENQQPQSSQAATDAKAASATPEPVTGKTAYWAMYKSAYTWANDVVPLKLESKSVAGVKNDAGKAGMWTGTFGSARRAEVVEISYSVVADPATDTMKGVSVGHGLPYSGPTPDVMPFQGSDIAFDSDAAYKTASVEAAGWLKTHPDKQPEFILGNNLRTFAAPVWYVKWGDTKDGYNAFINTKTGAIAKRAK
jgi:hypothetical protein